MNILIILNSFYPSIGGVEKVIENYCLELIRSGHKIWVLTFKKGQISELDLRKTPNMEEYKGIKIIRIENRFYGIWLFIYLLRLFKNIKFDIIHTTDFWALFPILFKIRYKVKLIHHLHGYQEICPSGLLLCANYSKFINETNSKENLNFKSFKDVGLKYCKKYCNINLFKALLEKFIYKIIWLFSDSIISVGKYVKKMYITKYPCLKNKILTLYNGVPECSLKIKPKSIKINEINQFINNSQNILLFVGRLIKYRGLDVILTNFKKLLNRLNDLKLIVVGDGPELDSLKRISNKFKLQNNILFTGILTGTDLLYVYKLASLLIMPIRFPEPLSTVVLEALSCGCPVITFNIGGMSEMIENDKNGILIEPFNFDNFLDRIVEILSNERLINDMRMNSIHIVDLKFNIKRQAKKLENIYNKLTS